MGKSSPGLWKAESGVETGGRQVDWEQPVGERGPREGTHAESELGYFAVKSSADSSGHSGANISPV